MHYTVKHWFLAIVACYLLASCGSDVPYLGPEPERPAIPQYPSLSFVDSTDVLTSDAFVQPDSLFSIRLNATKGDSLLTSLSISANGLTLDPSRIFINDSPATSSPIIIIGDEVNGFQWDMDIVAQSDTSKVIYEFKLEDETTRSDFLDILINTKLTAFTPPIIQFHGEKRDTVLTNESVSFDLFVEAIGSPIKEMTVYQASNIVSPDRLSFDGVPFSSNPLILSDEDRGGFRKTIDILSSFDEGRQGFTVELKDSLDNKFFTELSLVAIRRVVRFPSITLKRNQAIRLDDGEIFPIDPNTVIDSNSTHIRDVSEGSSDWDLTLMATNGAELKKVAEDLQFDNIVGDDIVSKAFASSIALPNRIMFSDTIFNTQDTIVQISSHLVSDKLEINDLYICNRGSDYFLIKIDSIDTSKEEYIIDLLY